MNVAFPTVLLAVQVYWPSSDVFTLENTKVFFDDITSLLNDHLTSGDGFPVVLHSTDNGWPSI